MAHPVAWDFMAQVLLESMDEGDFESARICATRLLLCEEEGITPNFRVVVASLLSPKKKKANGPGRPRGGALAPPLWKPVGLANEKLLKWGVGPEGKRFERLAQEFAMSVSSVKRAVNHYRKHRNRQPIIGLSDQTLGDVSKLMLIAIPQMIDILRKKDPQGWEALQEECRALYTSENPNLLVGDK
jgi:hypothetical protein